MVIINHTSLLRTPIFEKKKPALMPIHILVFPPQKSDCEFEQNEGPPVVSVEQELERFCLPQPPLQLSADAMRQATTVSGV